MNSQWAETSMMDPCVSARAEQTVVCEPVLMIDDSPTVRKIVETCLRRAGYEVIGFPDGVAALQWLAGPDARRPALVILDIGLPKMDGYKVAQALKKNDPHMIIVMLTRRNGVLDHLKARLAGACAYLVKPFQAEALLAVVRMQTGQHEALHAH